MDTTQGKVHAVVFCKEQKWQEFCIFIVFLCQYIHSFVLPKISGGGPT